MSINASKTSLDVKKMMQKFCNIAKCQYLCNVFHGIRFKVNKGWDSAEPLFLCLYAKTAFGGYKIRLSCSMHIF